MVKEKRKGFSICVCDWCGEEFTRRTAEVNRSLKLGMGQFHKGACATKWGNAHATEEMKRVATERLRAIGYKRQPDEMSPFRYFHHNIRNRRRADGSLAEVSLTMDDLRRLWEEQKGKCPYTGVEMILPTRTHNPWPTDVPMYMRPSLDRIDSSKGYVPGNVQFISQMANNAKNSHSHEEMIQFCRAIAQYWSDPLDDDDPVE